MVLKLFLNRFIPFPCSCLAATKISALGAFSMVFPNRTFYLYAATEEEATEWIRLLKWKLVNLVFVVIGRLHAINMIKVQSSLVITRSLGAIHGGPLYMKGAL